MNPLRLAHAAGIETVAADGTVLDAWFPRPTLGSRQPGIEPWIVPAELEALVSAPPAGDALRAVTNRFVNIEINLDAAPTGTADAYLRLHLLSHCLVRPGEVNLDNIYAALPNVVWTTIGPMLPSVYAERLPLLRRSGVSATSVDRFPRLTDYVVPADVRIADTARVRLGAHLAPGTTVAHEGALSFDAGTLGPATIAGRIAQGVTIGVGSDVGSGANVTAALPRGERVWIGERALLGANSGLGIALGDESVVEPGLTLTAGTRVLVLQGTPDSGGQPTTVKAGELSGAPGLLFRRNSQTGAVEALRVSAA